jgi:hypothetical protein
MAIDSYGAKITRRDVTELATASEQLAAVSRLINSSGVKWADAATQLLISANNVIVRIQNKGAAAFARYLQKHPPETPQAAAAGEIPGERANQGEKIDSGEAEED